MATPTPATPPRTRMEGPGLYVLRTMDGRELGWIDRSDAAFTAWANRPPRDGAGRAQSRRCRTLHEAETFVRAHGTPL